MKTRIYNKKINLDNSSTEDFWRHQSTASEYNLRTVLLGSDPSGIEQEKRNQTELEVVYTITKEINNINILDIGCGIGRWAENLFGQYNSYIGIDYSDEFITYNKNKFKKQENITFYKMSVEDLNIKQFSPNNINFVICTGVLMYLNDDKLPQFFDFLTKLAPEYIYIQESISLMNDRLTLNQFSSKELNTSYNAIYRTKQEYEHFYKNFDIIKTDLLLDKNLGAREETNAQYWILRGKNNDRK